MKATEPDGCRIAEGVGDLCALEVDADVAVGVGLEVQLKQRLGARAEPWRQVEIEIADVEALQIRMPRVLVGNADVGEAVYWETTGVAAARGVGDLHLCDFVFDRFDPLCVGGRRSSSDSRRRCRVRGFQLLHALRQRLDHFQALVEFLLQLRDLLALAAGTPRRYRRNGAERGDSERQAARGVSKLLVHAASQMLNILERRIACRWCHRMRRGGRHQIALAQFLVSEPSSSCNWPRGSKTSARMPCITCSSYFQNSNPSCCASCSVSSREPDRKCQLLRSRWWFARNARQSAGPSFSGS